VSGSAVADLAWSAAEETASEDMMCPLLVFVLVLGREGPVEDGPVVSLSVVLPVF
jgi:hypothetical protein